MKGCWLLIIGCVLYSGFCFSQVKVVKPIKTKPLTSKLAFGIGGAGSVLYLERNVKENNNAYGTQFSLAYGGSKILRGSLEYTYYKSMDMAPTWYDVKAQTIEANIHFLARFSESHAFFYPLFGISYNRFSGFYTGVNDFLNLSRLYEKNQEVVTLWYGFNIGTGYELFLKKFSFYIDYKMRVGVTEGYNELNIMDVCLSAGLRYNFRVPSVYSLFRGTRSRYLLRD